MFHHLRYVSNSKNVNAPKKENEMEIGIIKKVRSFKEVVWFVFLTKVILKVIPGF